MMLMKDCQKRPRRLIQKKSQNLTHRRGCQSMLQAMQWPIQWLL